MDAATINVGDTTPPLEHTQTKYTLGWVAATNGQPNTIADFEGAYDHMVGEPEGPMGVMFVLNMVTPGVDYYEAAGFPALPALNGRPARAAVAGPISIDQTPGSDDWWAMLDDRYLRNLSMLQDAQSRGIPIEYIEFGNEYYFGSNLIGDSSNGSITEPYSAGGWLSTSPFQLDPDNWGTFPERDTAWDADGDQDRGRAYAVAVNDWAALLLAEFPGVRLCAIGATPNGTGPSRRNDWNRDVLGQVDKNLVRAASYHPYGLVDGTITGSESQLGVALASFQTNWAVEKAAAGIPGDREMWMSEWNSNDARDSWSNGLVSVFQLLYWLETEDLGLSTYHQFREDILASGGNITGAGRAFSLLSHASKGRTYYWPVQLSGISNMDGQASLPAVQMHAFGEEGNPSMRFLILNTSDNAVSLDLSALSPTGNYTRTSSSLTSSSADPGETSGLATTSMVVPAYSITVFDGSFAVAPVLPVFDDFTDDTSTDYGVYQYVAGTDADVVMTYNNNDPVTPSDTVTLAFEGGSGFDFGRYSRSVSLDLTEGEISVSLFITDAPTAGFNTIRDGFVIGFEMSGGGEILVQTQNNWLGSAATNFRIKSGNDFDTGLLTSYATNLTNKRVTLILGQENVTFEVDGAVLYSGPHGMDLFWEHGAKPFFEWRRSYGSQTPSGSIDFFEADGNQTQDRAETIIQLEVISGSDASVTVPTENDGLTYQLQKRTYPSSYWTDVGGQSVAGDGGVHVLNDPGGVAAGSKTFYRVTRN
jgi:hypothetical protein